MSKFPAGLFPLPGTLPADKFAFLGMVPYGANRLLAYFSDVPVGDDPEGFDSVTNVANWTIDAVDPSQPRVADPDNPFVPEGEVVPVYSPEVGMVTVDEDDARQVHLWFNTRLEQGVRFDVTVGTALRTKNCDDLESGTPFTLTHRVRALQIGVGPTPRFVTQDTLRDFDWRYFPTDTLQPPGTWRYDTTGDIGIQSEDESLRKRLYRRITAKRRSFRNLPDDYGGVLDVKALARAGRIQELANLVAEQARLEPDVRDAGAQAKLTFAADGTVIVELTVRAVRVGRRESQFVLDVPLTSTDA